MKNVFLVYDTSCFFEFAILSYFMQCSGRETVLCSPEGKPIHAMEGYSVNADISLDMLDLNDVESFIVPGGEIAGINKEAVGNVLRELKKRHVLIAGICAGVDLLEDAGILKDVSSIRSTGEDLVSDGGIITSAANRYVDFAIETAGALGLFEDEADLQETIDFWKYFKPSLPKTQTAANSGVMEE